MIATAPIVAAPTPVRTRITSALLTAAALCIGTAPAGAQQSDTRTTPPAARRLPAPAAAAAQAETGGFGLEFWRRLRDDARRFREMSSGPHHFSLRYRITPEMARTIHEAAHAEGIDPELGFRLVRAESNFNARARSHAGAMGLTQLMPGTARHLDRTMTTPARVMDPERNLRAGFRYLRQMLERYDGNVNLALLAYNRGYVAVDRDLRRGRSPENGYTRRVLGSGMDRYAGTGRSTPQAPAR